MKIYKSAAYTQTFLKKSHDKLPHLNAKETQEPNKISYVFMESLVLANQRTQNMLQNLWGKHFIWINLAGIERLEELFGFSFTYHGSRPGLLVRELQKAKTRDVVILFDKLEKTSPAISQSLIDLFDGTSEFFIDKYLETPVSLKGMTFFTATNDKEKIPAALKSRMEVLEIPNPSFSQKVKILTDNIEKYKESLGLVGEQYSSITVTKEQIKHLVLAFSAQEVGLRETERALRSALENAGLSIDLGENVTAIDTPQLRKAPIQRTKGTCLRLSAEKESGCGEARTMHAKQTTKDTVHHTGFTNIEGGVERALLVLDIFNNRQPEQDRKHFSVQVEAGGVKLSGPSADLA